LYNLWDAILSEDKKSKELGFTEIVQFSVYNRLEQIFDSVKSKELTLEIHEKVSPMRVIDWEKPENENIQKDIRSEIKDILIKTKLEFIKRNELAIDITNLYMERENE